MTTGRINQVAALGSPKALAGRGLAPVSAWLTDSPPRRMGPRLGVGPGAGTHFTQSYS
jgi:hypothetical protein